MINQISNEQMNAAALTDTDLDGVAGGWGFNFGSFFSTLFGGAHSGSILSNNGANILSNNGANILSNNGANLIPRMR